MGLLKGRIRFGGLRANNGGDSSGRLQMEKDWLDWANLWLHA
jgi:hypothetical protein